MAQKWNCFNNVHLISQMKCRCWLQVVLHVKDKNKQWFDTKGGNLHGKCFLCSDKSTWEHIGICRSYGARSSPMWCASCSVSVAGSTVSCQTFTVLLDPPDLTRPEDWGIRPSKVSTEPSYTHKWLVTVFAIMLMMLFFYSNRLRCLSYPCAPWRP